VNAVDTTKTGLITMMEGYHARLDGNGKVGQRIEGAKGAANRLVESLIGDAPGDFRCPLEPMKIRFQVNQSVTTHERHPISISETHQ
jgi:hypothetical protein